MIRKSEATMKNVLFTRKVMDVRLNLCLLFILYTTGVVEAQDYGPQKRVVYKKKNAPDGHRCGVCPTYFQKICAFDLSTNSTHIFDNHCIMDLYNCMEGTVFAPMNYDKCLYFGNFAYVHGYKYEDEDYGEDFIKVQNSKKNPDFV